MAFPRTTRARGFPLAVRVVLIDLDGTLIDTAPDLVSATNRMLVELDRPTMDAGSIKRWIGGGVSRLVEQVLNRGADPDPDAVQLEHARSIFIRHYRACLVEQSRPFDGVVECLDVLVSRGFHLACVTNKPAAFTQPLLERLDLMKYFALVVSGDTLPRRKPDPLPLHHACEHFAATPSSAVLVGDSEVDVLSARAADMPVFCVTYGYNHGRDIRSVRPDAVVDSLRDVPQLLHLDS